MASSYSPFITGWMKLNVSNSHIFSTIDFQKLLKLFFGVGPDGTTTGLLLLLLSMLDLEVSNVKILLNST